MAWMKQANHVGTPRGGACQTDRTHCPAAALPDWHGSLFWRSPLGLGICQVWPHNSHDGAQISHPVPDWAACHFNASMVFVNGGNPNEATFSSNTVARRLRARVDIVSCFKLIADS